MWGAKELSHLSAQACAVFLGHRTPRVVLACGAALALYRLSEAALGWEDVLGAFAASHAAVALQHGLLPRALASPPAPPRAPQWPAGRPASGWRRSGRSTRASCTPRGHGLVRGPLRGARRAAPGWTCHVPRTEPDGRRGGRERWADAPAGAVRRLTGRTRMAAPGQTLFPFNLYSTCGAGRDLHEDHTTRPTSTSASTAWSWSRPSWRSRRWRSARHSPARRRSAALRRSPTGRPAWPTCGRTSSCTCPSRRARATRRLCAGTTCCAPTPREASAA